MLLDVILIPFCRKLFNRKYCTKANTEVCVSSRMAGQLQLVLYDLEIAFCLKFQTALHPQ